MKRFLLFALALILLAVTLGSCSLNVNEGDIEKLESIINDLNNYLESDTEVVSAVSEKAQIDENGIYDQKDDVALYIHTYNKLPKNFITKDCARVLGWEGGSVEKYAPNTCIGGDYFGNYEEILPTKTGRTYTECDINTLGKDSRGAERIVFSNDGLIYYTDDHYETFELLYGDEN